MTLHIRGMQGKFIGWRRRRRTRVKELHSLSSIKGIWLVTSKGVNITTFLGCQDLHKIISLAKGPLTFISIYIHMPTDIEN